MSSNPLTSLSLARPDDWHVHFRDGDMLKSVVEYTAAHFARAIVMPNLVPPVVNIEQAREYAARIRAVLPGDGPAASFEPLMTLYLTESTTPADISAAVADGLVKAVKLYPAGATTNSQSGVTDIERVMPVLECMADCGLPLCVHGEVTDAAVDIFDREAVFIERVLAPLRNRLPELRVIMEHVTTRDGVEYVRSQDQHLAATITPHHLIINRNHMLVGGIRPHYYCLPIVKRESHRQALRQAATSGDARFFLGTDSAPHTDSNKETACGCAGVFNAPNTLACLAHVFEEEQALAHLERFCSTNGPGFYQLPVNEERITLVRHEQPWHYPRSLETGMPSAHASGGVESVTVFDPGFELFWQVA